MSEKVFHVFKAAVQLVFQSSELSRSVKRTMDCSAASVDSYTHTSLEHIDIDQFVLKYQSVIVAQLYFPSAVIMYKWFLNRISRKKSFMIVKISGLM